MSLAMHRVDREQTHVITAMVAKLCCRGYRVPYDYARPGDRDLVVRGLKNGMGGRDPRCDLAPALKRPMTRSSRCPRSGLLASSGTFAVGS